MTMHAYVYTYVHELQDYLQSWTSLNSLAIHTYGTAPEQVYSAHQSTRMPQRCFIHVLNVSKQITSARNYAHKLCYMRFLRINTHSQAI